MPLTNCLCNLPINGACPDGREMMKARAFNCLLAVCLNGRKSEDGEKKKTRKVQEMSEERES